MVNKYLTYHKRHNKIIPVIENHPINQLRSAGSNPVGTAEYNILGIDEKPTSESRFFVLQLLGNLSETKIRIQVSHVSVQSRLAPCDIPSTLRQHLPQLVGINTP